LTSLAITLSPPMEEDQGSRRNMPCELFWQRGEERSEQSRRKQCRDAMRHDLSQEEGMSERDSES